MIPTNSTTENKQVCSIKIMLPVISDEQAIDYKKKIAEVLSDIPEAIIDFRLISGRPPMQGG